MQTPTVPDAIKTPAGEKLVLIASARGFQIYVCRKDESGKPTWTLKAPEAELFDEQNNAIGTHFGGPTWKHNDGSELIGKMAAKADPPSAGTIPWLLVAVTGSTGSGVLSGVTTIQRINTVGGMPPGSGCKEDSLETEFKSRYTADYYFYRRA